ncbi:hypothetical protein D0Y65_005923 [Glycine soja]|uniref:Uncharacterized protein n=1 Tax=Glycine soja TaxID=3848 RepID=A0A445L6P7_GLYSO|nr:hypothetical protein D0Y65_005923 [Glycine soja]
MMVFQATRFDLFVHKRCLLFVFSLVCRFVFLLSLSTLKFFCVPEPFPTLLSLGFLTFWVQICSIGYLCDRQQQRRQQIEFDMKRIGL